MKLSRRQVLPPAQPRSSVSSNKTDTSHYAPRSTHHIVGENSATSSLPRGDLRASPYRGPILIVRSGVGGSRRRLSRVHLASYLTSSLTSSCAKAIVESANFRLSRHRSRRVLPRLEPFGFNRGVELQDYHVISQSKRPATIGRLASPLAVAQDLSSCY